MVIFNCPIDCAQNCLPDGGYPTASQQNTPRPCRAGRSPFCFFRPLRFGKSSREADYLSYTLLWLCGCERHQTPPYPHPKELLTSQCYVFMLFYFLGGGVGGPNPKWPFEVSKKKTKKKEEEEKQKKVQGATAQLLEGWETDWENNLNAMGKPCSLHQTGWAFHGENRWVFFEVLDFEFSVFSEYHRKRQHNNCK